MNEIGEWLGPAIALIWVLIKVVPRLFRARPSTGDPEGSPAMEFTRSSPGSEDPDGSAMAPPPIEPR